MSPVKNLIKTSVLVLAVTLILSLISAPAPVTAINGTPPSLEIDPHPTITATVSTQFTIQIWIRNIPEGFTLASLDFAVNWDPTQMALVSHQEFTPAGKNWINIGPAIGGDYYKLEARSQTEADVTNVEMAWASLTFHCLAEGTSKITVRTLAEATVTLYDGESKYPTYPDPFEITCNQIRPRPVGGIVTSVNKLQVLAPYLALAGLVAIVSTVVVVKRRGD